MGTPNIAHLRRRVESLKCKGLCAAYCGPIEVGHIEMAKVRAYREGQGLPVLPFDNLDSVYKAAVMDDTSVLEPCQYLAEGRCSIYPVRPMICRLWGATETMPCPHGCEPDGGRLTAEEAKRLLFRAWGKDDA